MSLSATPLLRILVVDDEEVIHMQMRRLMQVPPPANTEIVSARGLVEAEELIRERRPSAILLDLNLASDWPWDRTLCMIRPLEELANAPVIAFSGLDPDEMWPRSVVEFGAYNYFSKKDVLEPSEFVKPIFRAQLLRDITNAIFQRKFRIGGGGVLSPPSSVLSGGVPNKAASGLSTEHLQLSTPSSPPHVPA